MRNTNNLMADNGGGWFHISDFDPIIYNKKYDDAMKNAKKAVRKIGDPIRDAYNGSGQEDSNLLNYHLGNWDPNTEEYYVNNVPVSKYKGIPSENVGTTYNNPSPNDWGVDSKANMLQKWMGKLFGEDFANYDFEQSYLKNPKAQAYFKKHNRK